MDGGITETEQTVDWRATVHEITESDTTERLTRHKEKILSFGSNMYTVSAHLILSALCTVSLGSQSGMFIHTTFRNLPVVKEIKVQSLGWEDPPEKGMATHSSLLAWRIPWTEEPGGLQLQRIGHD